MPIIDNNNTSTESDAYQAAKDYFTNQVGYNYIPNGVQAQLLVPEIGLGALNLMGAITGAMTSTASLNIVMDMAKSQVPALGYAGSYTVANVILTFFGALLVLM